MKKTHPMQTARMERVEHIDFRRTDILQVRHFEPKTETKGNAR